MEKIGLFVILACLLSCSEQKIDMNTSHALPIEFWDIDEETYNEKQVCGITPICFCQPRICSDEIQIVLPTETVIDTPNDYNLLIKENDLLIKSIPFQRYTTSVIETNINQDTEFETDLNGWFNTNGSGTAPASGGSTPDWAWFSSFGGCAKVQTYTSFGTKPLRFSGLSVPQEEFTIRVRYAIIGASSIDMPLRLIIRNASNTQLYEITITPIRDANQHYFYAVISSAAIWENADYMLLLTNSTGYVAGDQILFTDVIIYSGTDAPYSINHQTSRYLLSVVPNDYDLCNKQVRLYIANDDSPNTLIKKSDCISFKNSHPCTTLIEYSNATDFDGIENSSSPMTIFNLLIPAIFFEEQNTKEGEDIELSNDEIIRLYDKIEEKRLLQIGFMPHYMHRKLLLALSFDFVTIDGKEWIARDEYKKNDGDRHYPLKTASILLTDKNFIKENQL